MLSKACIVGQYQSKLEALARYPGIELTVVVPPFWRDERGIVALERAHTNGYTLLVSPARFNGHFHLHYYPALPSILNRVRPDVVHIDEEPYNLATILAVAASRQAGARALFFTWQNIRRNYPIPFSSIEQYVYKNSQHAIAGNYEAVQVLRSKGYSGPCTVIPQFGLDPSQFKPRALDAVGEDFRIGFVGRLVKEKGPEVLLNAVANLKSNWQLEYIGSGPLRRRLETLALSLGIRERVSFSNWRPSSDMPTVYRELDLLVVPSLTRPNWKEQFGRVVIEAMASQIPVIASNSGELPNVIGNAGILVPEGDPTELGKAIESLSCDPPRRTELGKRGRARVLEHFTQERVASATIDVYRRMLAPK